MIFIYKYIIIDVYIYIYTQVHLSLSLSIIKSIIKCTIIECKLIYYTISNVKYQMYQIIYCTIIKCRWEGALALLAGMPLRRLRVDKVVQH